MTPLLQRLLTVLSDGELHSGQDLAAAVGLSRTAIWKHLQQMATFDVAIESARGRGYRLPGGLELLDRERILAALTPRARALLGELQVLASIDSTNSQVRRQPNASQPLAVLAECQTAGRGRLGRTWVSPFGRNLYLSVGWSFSDGAASLAGLSLAVGVAAHRALTAIGVTGLGLKWPNDILRDRHKVGGILLEVTGDPAGSCQVIVGIGINVAMPHAAAVAIEQPWADLADVGEVTRNGLAAAVLSELLPVLADFPTTGFAAYQEEWELHDAYRGARVRIATPGTQIEGIARGVTAGGALRLDVDGREHLINGGEMCLRGVP